MSKKSKEKRAKRKSRKSTFTSGATPSRPQSSSRLLWMRAAARSDLTHSRHEIAARCDVPLEKLTLLLLAAHAERIEDENDPVPLYTHDGVAVFVTPTAAKNVAITSGFIFPKKQESSDTEEGRS